MTINDRVFRSELKYLINIADKEIVKSRLNGILQLDENAVNGKYKVRSLYFDDYWNTAYEEKLMGVYDRKKYRIRIYDDSDSKITLECKIKKGNFVHKDSASLSRDECDMLINGEYSFLLQRYEEVCKRFYFECVSRVMRPRFIIDYDREPFVMEAGDVRVTFDNDVRVGTMGTSIFNPDMPAVHVLPPGMTIMEVKYTEFFPSVVKNAVPPRASELSALSKYVLCYEKASFLTNEVYYNY